MALPALVKSPPEFRLGPAMQALNERQRKFVVAMLEFPSITYTKAAIIAGYGKTEESSQVHSSRLAHDEKIQAAILEESKRRLNAGVAMASSWLLKIADDPMTQTKDRLKALDMIMNRGGIPELKEQKVTVEHVNSDEDTIARLVRLAKVMGTTPEKILGSMGAKMIEGKIIDAEFTEVKDGVEQNVGRAETERGSSNGQEREVAHSNHNRTEGSDEFAFDPSAED